MHGLVEGDGRSRGRRAARYRECVREPRAIVRAHVAVREERLVDRRDDFAATEAVPHDERSGPVVEQRPRAARGRCVASRGIRRDVRDARGRELRVATG